MNRPAIKPPDDGRPDVLADPPIKLKPVSSKLGETRLAEFYAIPGTVARLPAAVDSFLASVFDLSPYLFDLACKHQETVAHCCQSFTAARDAALNEADLTGEALLDQNSVMQSLRHMKQRIALVCGLADLGGWWSCNRVTETLAETADKALQTTVRHLLLAYHASGKLRLPNEEVPEEGCGYAVFAMGKHGAMELNYSSDTDLIVFFDPNAPAVVDPVESVALFARFTKSLIKIMQERTSDGYVFRTDLRLRPDPGSMPLAVPIGAALAYYESRGQNWERAALIKARLVAGDTETGDLILRELTPFVWRRYLDYAAIADIHSIKRQIQAHKGYTGLNVAGHNVKLGRGGIREIEFFVQTQQLIAGGRLPALRGRKTLEMLTALVEHGWIEQAVCDDLTAAYHYLRDVEHRIQMVADEQTHIVPSDEEGLKRLAGMCGFRNVDAFTKATQHHLTLVETHYADLFADAPTLSGGLGNLSFTGDDDDPGTLETLAGLGYERPSSIIALVRGWHFGRYRAMQTVEAREHLTELTPVLLQAFAKGGRPDETATAFDGFLKGLPAGFQLLSLLRANPEILSLLALVLSAAPRLADTITRRSHVFDSLLEPGFFEDLPDAERLADSLARSLRQASGYEDGLDRARIFAAEQKFLIGIRLLSFAVPLGRAGEAYSLLADVTLTAMVEWVHQEFQKRHGVVAGGAFAVVGMGNLGTRELTAASDLDLIMLYEHDNEHDESDGEKPLHVTQYYARLTQRLIAAMSAPTAEGTIYELDFRLRPSGNSGPLATSLRSFKKYQHENAWTWERMALTRARVVCADGEFGERVREVIDEIVAEPRSEARTAADILEMRMLMDQERPPVHAWDVKLQKGGLIDIEFLAQWSVLTGVSPKAGTTREVVSSLEAGLQNSDVNLRVAFDAFSNVAQLLRLCLDQSVSPEDWPRGLIDLILKEMDLPDIGAALATLTGMQKQVRGLFLDIMQSASKRTG